MGPDKATVVRIKRAAFERVKARYPHCAVIVGNLEEHVQRAEKEMLATPEATWFQAYVSIQLVVHGGMKIRI